MFLATVHTPLFMHAPAVCHVPKGEKFLRITSVKLQVHDPSSSLRRSLVCARVLRFVAPMTLTV